MSKYNAKAMQVGNEKYRSKREMHRHQELLLLQRAGQIAGLTREVPFVLAPGVQIAGEFRKRPAVRYVADYVYSDVASGAVIVEDAKGMQTPVFRLKKHLMKSVHGIDVRVV